MSIVQQHTAASLSDAWRTINIDALQEDSSLNFDTTTLHPPLPEISETEVRQLAGQVRQLLRGGDSEGALRGCLEMPVYNGTDSAKVSALFHLGIFEPRGGRARRPRSAGLGCGCLRLVPVDPRMRPCKW